MNYSEISEMTVLEIKKKKAAVKDELFDSRIKNAIGQMSNPLKIRFLRKDIARLNTALAKKVVR